VSEDQALKPLGPAGIQVFLEANFLQMRLVMILSGCVWCTHVAPRACSSCGYISTSSPVFVSSLASVAWWEDTGSCGDAASPHVV